MELNFSRIKSEIIKAGYTIGDFCLEIDRSDKWLFVAETKSNMKVSDLCSIAVKLNKPIQHFIDNNIETGSAEDLLNEVDLLQRILKVNKQILENIETMRKP